MTTLTLSEPGGETLNLWQVQLSENPTEGSADVFNAPGIGSEEAFISLLAERERFDLTGLVTGPRLSTQSGYNADPRTALAEYAVTLEAFAASDQGTGFTLNEADRGRASVNVCVESATWTYEHGAVLQLSFELTLHRGDGLFPTGSVSVPTVTPGGTGSVPTLDGNTLDGFDRLEATKTLGDWQVFERAFAEDAGDNDIFAGQGATRVYDYRGQFAGTNAERNSFDDTMRALVDDNVHTFSTVFPGYSVDVKVLNFDSNRSWETGASSHEYSVTVQEATGGAPMATPL